MMRLSRCLFLIVFLLLLLLPAGFPAAAADFSLPPAEGGLPACWDWYCGDRERLQQCWESSGWQEREMKEKIREEWFLLAAALHDLYETGAVYEDPAEHYYIYDVHRVARMHVLSLAKEAREELAFFWAEGGKTGSAFSFRYPEWGSLSYVAEDSPGKGFLGLGTEVLRGEEDAGWIPWEEVRDSLNRLNLPPGLLSGCRIFLLPGEITGAAGFSVTSFLPLREEKIFLSGIRGGNGGSLDAVLAHEAGHCLHYQFMGDYSSCPEAWEEYLRLRGQKSFCGEGRWSDLTEENFAEDFKVLFGNFEAQKEGHRGSYGDPRLNPPRAAALKRFMGQLLTKEEALPLNFARVAVSGGKKERLVLSQGVNREKWVAFSATVWLRGELEGLPAEGVSAGLAVKKGDTVLYVLNLGLEPEEGRQVFKRQVTFSCPGCYQLLLGALDTERNELTVYKTVDVAYLAW